jgi:hypothetical protein
VEHIFFLHDINSVKFLIPPRITVMSTQNDGLYKNTRSCGTKPPSSFLGMMIKI